MRMAQVMMATLHWGWGKVDIIKDIEVVDYVSPKLRKEVLL